MSRVLLVLSIWLAGLALSPAGPVRAVIGITSQPAGLDQAIDQAFLAAFNLDHEIAVAAARRAVALAPDQSRAHRTLAAILWIDVLFERGALSVDHYVGGLSKADSERAAPPPALDEEFRREIALAIEIARRRLDADPDDVSARYDLGAAYAIEASYIASVEGSMRAALGSARRAFDAQEKVLEQDPRRVEAGTVVGTYRYAVSAMRLPTRMLAYIVGFGGGKERGIALLQAAAAAASNVKAEAKTALVLILSREGRHAEVVQILAELESQFPRNRLFVLERGAAAIRAGEFEEAAATLERGLDAFEQDPRRKLPGEQALWHYKLGLSYLGQGQTADAASELSAALSSRPAAWVRARSHLARGQLADLTNRRAEAIEEYRAATQVGRLANDHWCLSRAERYLDEPFRLAAVR